MRVNPVFHKEIRVGTRSIRLPLTLMFYVLVLGGAVIYSLTGPLFSGNLWGMTFRYDQMSDLFLLLGYVQLFLVSLIMPVMAGAAISSEREKQTLDILMSTPLSPVSIITGKLFHVMIRIMLYAAASIPVMAVAFLYGGLPWYYLPGFLGVILVFSFVNGSIGLFCSVMIKRTIPSIITSMLIEAAFYSLLWFTKASWVIGLVLAGFLGLIFVLAAARKLDRVYGPGFRRRL